MAKKKSRAIVKKGPAAKVNTVFDCPKCSHSQCVEVKLKRKLLTANLSCRVCRAKAEFNVNHLEKEVQVYCRWKDRMEEEEEQRRLGRGLGFQRQNEEYDSAQREQEPSRKQQTHASGTPRDELDSEDDMGNQRVDSRSKSILKPKKF